MVAESQQANSSEAQKRILEKRLIQQVLLGNAESFCELIRPYERSIFFRALSMLNNEADAEEVVQEAILKAFRNLVQFRSECKFSTWFTQIAINEARIKLRKDRRHLYESLESGRQSHGRRRTLREFVQWRETPLEFVERKELSRTILRSLESLPFKYRSVLILRQLQELSTLDTARTLGITEVNVKIRLLRARLQMRDALESWPLRKPRQTTIHLYGPTALPLFRANPCATSKGVSGPGGPRLR
jgi:RNA polymerase sigma-70 factor, ECF subfamily